MLRGMSREEDRFVSPLTHRIRAQLQDAMSAPDTLVALTALTDLRGELETLERDRVRYALEDGVSFAAVARALGITRQAAHRRYRELAGARRRAADAGGADAGDAGDVRGRARRRRRSGPSTSTACT